MAGNFIILTPDDLLDLITVDPQMVKDLQSVASIKVDQIKSLAEALLQTDGFFTKETLGQIAGEYIPDEEQASAAASTIYNLSPGAIKQAIARIEAWREARPSNKVRFSDETFITLQSNLPLLVQDYPVISRMRKVRWLRGVLGNQLEKVDFICDARPVFNKDREHIEGLLAVTTLKLLYERQSNTTDEIEIVLTIEQLDDLIAKAQKAQQKLRVLEQSFDRWVDGNMCLSSDATKDKIDE